MRYRTLGRTGLMVSEIGFGGEWLERHTREEGVELIQHAHSLGINLLDCWMSDPEVRSTIGEAMRGCREDWMIQGHIGSTWQNGQYVRTRQFPVVKEAFEDLLERLETDYIDLGMIHYVDQESDWEEIINGPFIEYVKELKDAGTIRHIGISTHNPRIAMKAIDSGLVEMIMFSINPAYDMLPPSEDVQSMYAKEYDAELGGIEPERAALYSRCEQEEIGITIMKPYAAGRLFNAEASAFGVALTPVQCIHYGLTRPAAACVIPGYDTPEQIDEAVSYEHASEEEKNYAAVLANAPRHSCSGQCVYCGHCKPCPVHIDIAMVNKFYDLAVMQPDVPASVKDHYFALEKTAADCIHCGGCETRCPFQVPIVDRMKKAAELFQPV